MSKDSKPVFYPPLTPAQTKVMLDFLKRHYAIKKMIEDERKKLEEVTDG